jgi:ATP-dependent helicase HrpB
VEWNRGAERVEGVSAIMFDQIAIQESRGAPEPEAAAALLAAKAVEAGLARFAEPEAIEAWIGRAEFAARHSAVPPLAPRATEAALQSLALGLKSFAELEGAGRGGGLLRALQEQIPAPARRQIDEIAPERIRLPRGGQVRVHYERDRPPWIESRIQDFFGMRATPAVAGGAVPVVVRLLAPSQRPVQTTTDLAGFWQRLYPEVRKELARKYPKHLWPEDPAK